MKSTQVESSRILQSLPTHHHDELQKIGLHTVENKLKIKNIEKGLE